VTDELIS
jgi:signal-transduction protein with cAMP-binding, CBS, and nucleotidyltransferase domain